MPNKSKDFTIALYGKIIRSTAKMDNYKSSLHIVSAYILELGMTFAQKSIGDKSNEIKVISKIMFDCLIDCSYLLKVIYEN